MKQATQSSFNDGLVMDMNPLITPQTCLTDCLNGTIITFNGNEFTLQNDSGNVKIDGSNLPNGFIPVGMKEYGGIIYTALLNPVTNKCQIGSIPSPDYSVTPKNQSSDGVQLSFSSSGKFTNTVTKLFEFDQLVLNPGDKYKICYTFDKDISPLYKVRWLAIDESGKEYTIDDPNIIYGDGTIGDFKYFDQTIRGIIAVEVTLNQIDWFEAAAYSFKEDGDKFNIKLILNGKNKLQDTDKDEDDLLIKGCRVEYTSPNAPESTINKTTTQTTYIYEDSIESSDEFGGSIDLLVEGENGKEYYDSDQDVSISIIPFDKYGYLQNLKRNLIVKTGQIYAASGFNDIFQYKYSSSNKSLRLDFDAKLQGMSDPKVYLEFYDVWSHYSVIVPVNDPNPYGKNSIFIKTSSEKCTYDFISSRGGVSNLQIEQYEDSEEDVYKPTLFNNSEDRVIRTSQILRENNLYIVKISIIENSLDKENIKYHDTYKVFTLNENMNLKYEEYQLTENPYLKDFSQLAQAKSSIKLGYEYISKEESSVTHVNNTELLNNGVNDRYYKLLTEDENNGVDISNTHKSIKTVKSSRKYSLKITSSEQTLGYGVIKDVQLGDSIKVNSINKNIVETDQSITNSESNVLVEKQNDEFIIINELTTNREITANVSKEVRLIRSEYNTKSVWDTLVLGDNEGPSGYINVWGNIHHPRRIYKYGVSGSVVNVENYISNTEVQNYFNNPTVNGNRVISGGVLYWKNTATSYTDQDGYEHDKWCNHAVNGTNTPTHINEFLIFLRNADSYYYPVYFQDKNEVIKILKNIFCSNIIDGNKYLYYYGSVESNQDSKTYTKPDVNFSIQSTNVFEQYSHYDKTSYNQSNIADHLNNLINRSIGNAEDNYEDYVLSSNMYLQVVNTTGEANIQVSLDPIEINTGVDLTTLSKIRSSKNDLEVIESSKLISSNKTNSKPYSDLYPSIANRFTASYYGKNPMFNYGHNLSNSEWSVEGLGDKNNKPSYKIATSIFEIS